ncbi:serine/threonine protein kinase [Paenibacillus zeisoli]|uniref:non-specific serine/threonine protein kinase n=1 Tax=Paenibacillus zeisoli TaxID=2496267 RepID=A0A3S1E1P4_9BACL|nr:serine/threonine-protein kinase [Paenibacillus zeisoli]RUT35948.1 serine/threonine protein kinase [Paenibacillus zeisoli]
MHFPSKLEPGAILGGRYQIDKWVACGGMSHVYCASDLKLQDKKWAIKETLTVSEQNAKLEEEARLLIRLNHPRLPHIVDFFPPNDEGYTYLVMDFIDGVTLENYIAEINSRLNVEMVLHIAGQICEGLEYLHNYDPPIVYRDLKPSNLMVDQAGNIRFIDFGIARQFKVDQPEDTVKLGTVGFAAPEQYGGKQTDARTDLYSLGALLLYLVTGGQLSEWRPEALQLLRIDAEQNTTNALMKVIQKLLQYEPENRYASVREVRKALQLEIKHTFINRIQNEKSETSRTKVIAVIGVSSGVGTTHTAIMLAYSLSKHFKNVTLLELMDKSNAFSRLQAAAYKSKGSGAASAERTFTIEGVHYYRRPTRMEMLDLISGEDGLVILDLGSDRSKETFEEFLRADLSLVIGSGAEWRFQDILSFCRMSASYSKSKWIYAIPSAPMPVVQHLRKKLGTSRLLPFPHETDPFHPSDESVSVMENVCRTIIGKEKTTRFFKLGFKRMWRGGI